MRTAVQFATFYRRLGRLDEAEELLVQAIPEEWEASGSARREELWVKEEMAQVRLEQGRYDEAESLLLEVLEARKRVLGGEDKDTLRSMHDLARLYSEQGRYDEAGRLHLETLEIRRRVVGPSHWETLWSWYHLACVDALRGNRAKAMEGLRDGLDAGFSGAHWMAKDPNLETLHGPEFDALVERARQNAAAQQH
jgi:tetratricopeptide (TPR) repeat protein